jgi:two-component system, chemotaxis family, protein-glutamate methylesterase/glutaminase
VTTLPPLRPRTVRALIADDSAVMRGLLRMVLDTWPAIQVAATARSGAEAVAEFDRVHPDLVLLDIEMPGMNGLDALSAIRARNRRVPVLMCSTLTQRGAEITIEALARGATDYVSKPAAQKGIREAVDTLAHSLIPKIAAFFGPQPPPSTVPRLLPASSRPPVPRVVVLGVSTGGPAALDFLLPRIPAAFPLPILIVQHMPRLFTGLLAARLDSQCSLRVREAASGERPQPGVVHIARGDFHLELTGDFHLSLNQNEPENFCRPSADVLFRSAAAATAGRLLGVVLTGMGSDGLAGCRAIRSAGGTVYVQDSATSVIWGMPGAVANAGLASKILPLDAMADEIVRAAARPAAPAPEAAAR